MSGTAVRTCVRLHRVAAFVVAGRSCRTCVFPADNSESVRANETDKEKEREREREYLEKRTVSGVFVRRIAEVERGRKEGARCTIRCRV